MQPASIPVETAEGAANGEVTVKNVLQPRSASNPSDSPKQLYDDSKAKSQCVLHAKEEEPRRYVSSYIHPGVAALIVFAVLPYTFTMDVSSAAQALTGYTYFAHPDFFDKVGYVQWAQTGMGLLSDLLVVFGEKRRPFFIVCVIGIGIIYLVYYCKPSCFTSYNRFLGSYIFLQMLMQSMYATVNGLVVETARKQTRRQDDGLARMAAVISWMMMYRQIATLLCDVIYYSIQNSVNNKQLMAITAGMYLFTIPIILLLPRSLFAASADDRSVTRRSKKLVTNLRRSFSRMEYRNEWVCGVAAIIYIFVVSFLPMGMNAFLNAYFPSGPKWYSPTTTCISVFVAALAMAAAGFVLEYIARKEFKGQFRLTTFMVFVVGNAAGALCFLFSFVSVTKYKTNSKSARDFHIFENFWRNALNWVFTLSLVIFFGEHAPKGFEATVFETFSISMSGGSMVQGKIEAKFYNSLKIPAFSLTNVWKALLIGMVLRIVSIAPAYLLPDRRITNEVQVAGALAQKAAQAENGADENAKNHKQSEPYN